ncbi:MAG: SDR family NAD(P)-dependent oxidoreductase [Candidatus Acidiferrales bacterium]
MTPSDTSSGTTNAKAAGAAAGSGSTQLLAGKHALVTGGARGIGQAITRALMAHGARVTITGRDAQRLDRVSRELGAAFIVSDVTDRDDAVRTAKMARDTTGRIDILVNNAGQAGSAPFLRTDAELWRRMMAVNLDGTYHFTQAALPGMLESGWGRIVNLASTAGLVGYAYVSAYCAAKHAVIGLTRALAVEVAAKGVTVNAVCPGYTDTDMVRDSVEKIIAKTGRTKEAVLAEMISRNPQKRLVLPEEAANAVAWLCLPGSEAVNGQAIAIAGGEVM